MRFLQKTPDGGPESPVRAYFLFEIKGLCSIALLKFNKGSRDNFHSHAFNALTWFLWGDMEEYKVDGTSTPYKRSFLPKVTKKDNMHKVMAFKTSWCLTIRGPWQDTWKEYNEKYNRVTTLTHGRKIVKEEYL